MLSQLGDILKLAVINPTLQMRKLMLELLTLDDDLSEHIKVVSFLWVNIRIY